MISCLIVEDQAPAQRILERYIGDMPTLELVGKCTDAIQAMTYLNEHKIDLIFLDIHLPKMSGLEFLETLSNPPAVILTTAFPDYALKSYEFNVKDYLLKPFSFQRFVKAVQKATSYTILNSNDSISRLEFKTLFVKSGHDLIKVNTSEILYIKSDADYTELILSNKKILSGDSLKTWENKLNPKEFLRVHKSYIVNLSKVDRVSALKISLQENYLIPIGRTYKEDVLANFE